MTGLVNLIADRIATTNFDSPLVIVDLTIAVAFLLTFLIYIRRFPVFRVFLGVLLLWFASAVFFIGGLTFTALLFGVASNLVLISLPLIFAPEIRHYLEKLGRFSFVKFPRPTDSQRREVFINSLLDAVYNLGEKKLGATVILARRTGLGETVETGTELNAKFSAKLLETIFRKNTPLHDGAVVVKNTQVKAAGCLLPISGEVRLPPPFGTRHRSAVTITQDTDAVAVIVSEQRGQVSLAENGRLHANLTRAELRSYLERLL